MQQRFLKLERMYISWPKTQMLWSLLFEDSQFLVFRQPCLWEQVTIEEQFCWNNICPSWDIKSCSTSRISLFNRMWHMWTYCGIGKKSAFKACIETTPAELTALSQLGIEEMPSADVVLGFFCRLLGTKKTYRPTQLKNCGGSAFRANLRDG